MISRKVLFLLPIVMLVSALPAAIHADDTLANRIVEAGKEPWDNGSLHVFAELNRKYYKAEPPSEIVTAVEDFLASASTVDNSAHFGQSQDNINHSLAGAFQWASTTSTLNLNSSLDVVRNKTLNALPRMTAVEYIGRRGGHSEMLLQIVRDFIVSPDSYERGLAVQASTYLPDVPQDLVSPLSEELGKNSTGAAFYRGSCFVKLATLFDKAKTVSDQKSLLKAIRFRKSRISLRSRLKDSALDKEVLKEVEELP